MNNVNEQACKTIFSLVAGESSAVATKLPEPYRSGAAAIAKATKEKRAAAYNKWLDDLDKPLADQIRHAMRIHLAGETEEIIELDTLPELPKEARLTPQMEREAKRVGGWLDDWVAFASAACPMAPPEFHLALGLVIVAIAIARRVSLRVSTKDIFTNLYILIVAKSTLYRKSSAFNLAMAVIRQAGLSSLLMGTRQTPESIVMELSRRKPPKFDEWDADAKDAWRSERQFAAQRGLLLDEASGLFDSFKRDYSAGLLPMLLNWYDNPSIDLGDNTISRGRHTLHNIYLTIAGPTTPAAMAAHLGDRTHWENGLWARFSLITPTSLPVWQFWPAPVEVPASVTDPLNKLTFSKLPQPPTLDETEFGRAEEIKPVSVVLARGVWEAWDTYSKAVSHDLIKSGDVDGQILASYGRISEIAIKLAINLAVMDWITSKATAPTVGLGHWGRAFQIAESWRASLHRMIQTPATESISASNERNILLALSKSRNGLTIRELNRVTRISYEVIEVNLPRLQADGQIEMFDRKQARGPLARAYRYVNLSQK